MTDSRDDKPDTPNVDAFVQRFGAWGENDLRQAAKDWNDLLAFARQLERELAKAHKAQDTFKAAAVAACAQSETASLSRERIYEDALRHIAINGIAHKDWKFAQLVLDGRSVDEAKDEATQ